MRHFQVINKYQPKQSESWSTRVEVDWQDRRVTIFLWHGQGQSWEVFTGQASLLFSTPWTDFANVQPLVDWLEISGVQETLDEIQKDFVTVWRGERPHGQIFEPGASAFAMLCAEAVDVMRNCPRVYSDSCVCISKKKEGNYMKEKPITAPYLRKLLASIGLSRSCSSSTAVKGWKDYSYGYLIKTFKVGDQPPYFCILLQGGPRDDQQKKKDLPRIGRALRDAGIPFEINRDYYSILLQRAINIIK